MAVKGLVVFVMGMMMVLCSLMGYTEGRRLLTDVKSTSIPSGSDSLYLAALPKGKLPASTPSRKTHAVINEQKFIARHLRAVDRDRILQSVPSPGVGH